MRRDSRIPCRDSPIDLTSPLPSESSGRSSSPFDSRCIAEAMRFARDELGITLEDRKGGTDWRKA